MKKMLLIITLVLITGCSSTSLENEILVLTEKTESLEEELNKLKSEVVDLQAVNEDLTRENSGMRLKIESRVQYVNIPVFKLKLRTEIGMEMDYLIDSIDDNYIEYRVFDYQHYDEPFSEKHVMSFEELSEVEVIGQNKVPLYSLVPYIDFGDYNIELEPNVMFNEKFSTNSDFRKGVSEFINKAFDKKVSIALKYAELNGVE